MRPQVVKLAPKPSQVAIAQRRRAVAEERAGRAHTASADGISDPETVIEIDRAIIRAANRRIALLGGAARGLGVLAGAAAETAPAYRAEKVGLAAAEALFVRIEGEE